MLDVLLAKSDRRNLRNVRTLFLDSGDTNLLTGRYDVIVIGMALFGERITPATGLGMLLVLAACTLIGLQK